MDFMLAEPLPASWRVRSRTGILPVCVSCRLKLFPRVGPPAGTSPGRILTLFLNGGDGALRRPLSGASPSFAGQLPPSAPGGTRKFNFRSSLVISGNLRPSFVVFWDTYAVNLGTRMRGKEDWMAPTRRRRPATGWTERSVTTRRTICGVVQSPPTVTDQPVRHVLPCHET
jgi:hypothetical protein